MHVRYYYLVLAFLLLLTLPSISALSTSNPTPTLRIEYGPADAPVTIQNSYLLYDSGFQLPLQPTSQNGYEFDVAIQSFLLPGDYILVLDATDSDQNQQRIERSFSIEEPERFIWVSHPQVPYLTREAQDFAIGTSSPFRVELSTLLPATCRVKRYIPPLSGTAEDIFNEGGFSYFNNDPNLITRQHSINVTQTSNPNQYELPVTSTFRYDNLDANRYIVVCQQTNNQGQHFYFLESFYFGYDTSSPRLTANFTPQLIQDEFSIRTQLSVESDDLIYCTYDHVSNPSPEQDDVSGRFLEPSDITSLRDYPFSYQKQFGFPGKLFNLNTRTDFDLRLVCQNPALSSSTIVETYSVELSRTFSIDLQRNYFAQRNPELNFSTSLFSTCDATFQGETSTLSSQPSESHQLSLSNLEDGDYTVDVVCQATGLGAQQSQSFIFTVDSTPPVAPTLDAPSLTCGSDILPLTIFSPNATVQYNISLEFNNTIFSSELTPNQPTSQEITYSQSVPLEAVQGDSVTWIVRAINPADLESQESRLSIEISDFDPIRCDTIPPRHSVEVEESMQGFDVTVTCTDEQSGCEDFFSYGIVPFDATCPETVSIREPVNQTFTLIEEGKFCYEVTNRAGLRSRGELLLTSTPPSSSLDITLLSPRFGIGKTHSFVLAVETSLEASCVHGPASSQDPQTLFSSYEPFTSTGQQSHQHMIDTALHGFSSGETESQDWLVLCQDESGGIDSLSFELGYDLTPPVLTVQATPNPIINPRDISTTLQVTTSDPTVCIYLDNEGIPQGFGNYDPSIRSRYQTTHQVELSYFAPQESFAQRIVCLNVAQHVQDAFYSIDFSFQNELDITLLTPTISSSSPYTLRVSTNQDASCFYRQRTDMSLRSFSQSGSTRHEQTLRLLDGTHDIEIICETSSVTSYKPVSILIDTVAPKISLYSQAASCTAGDVVFLAAADGTGSRIAQRLYTLFSEGGEILSQGSFDGLTHTIIGDFDIEPYRLEVQVYDQANNSERRSIVLDDLCDTTPPQATYQATPRWKAYDITITCQDNIACAPDFLYSFTCDVDDAILQSYRPISIKETTDFCYYVYDKAGNLVTGERFIDMPLQCFNGIEDPEEEGVDCGGPCLAQCGLCDNGVQDPFEEGVDCGGPCPTSCTDFEPDFQPSEPDFEPSESDACFSNSDCPIGLRCIDGTCQESTPPPIIEESSPSLLGIILVLVGLLLVAGGVFYIRYSLEQKEIQQSYQQQQQLAQQQTVNQQKEVEQRSKRLEELKKKQAEQSKLRKERLGQRKAERKSLLDQFQKEPVVEEEPQQSVLEEEQDPIAPFAALEKLNTEESFKVPKDHLLTPEHHHEEPVVEEEPQQPASVFDELDTINISQALRTQLEEAKDLSGMVHELYLEKKYSLEQLQSALLALVSKGKISRIEADSIIKNLEQ